ncbi:hypothetical protein M5K25_015203 [Dendrobium thyrsiflorum]|uniref:Uncharacterized protein n=1 Tax=Dendrobium thyrsiflorum TaxID=117978 RepID=A0ABD0UQA3_DENTH
MTSNLAVATSTAAAAAIVNDVLTLLLRLLFMFCAGEDYEGYNCCRDTKHEKSSGYCRAAALLTCVGEFLQYACHVIDSNKTGSRRFYRLFITVPKISQKFFKESNKGRKMLSKEAKQLPLATLLRHYFTLKHAKLKQQQRHGDEDEESKPNTKEEKL